MAAHLKGAPRDNLAFTVIVDTRGLRMSSPSNFSGRPTDDSAALSDEKSLSTERRRRPPPSSSDEYLRALPASVLLDRIPVPMIALGLDGVVVYNNPAFATMLGHGPDVTLAGYGLPALLDGYSATPPSDCVTALRTANSVIVDWHHAEGFPVRSVISESLYIRATDQILLFGVTDLTELIWMYPESPWGP
jgi:PAS domain-containing protein